MDNNVTPPLRRARKTTAPAAKKGTSRPKSGPSKNRDNRLASHPTNKTLRKKNPPKSKKTGPSKTTPAAGDEVVCIVIDGDSPPPPPLVLKKAKARPIVTISSPLCRRSRMVSLLSKNDSKKNTEGYSSTMVKGILQVIMNNKAKILSTVQMDQPKNYDRMVAALEGAKCNTKTSKIVHAEGLVDIWLVFKQIPSLVAGSGGVSTRSTTLDTFIGIMETLELKTTTDISDFSTQVQNIISRKMPEGEMGRKFVGPGLAVDRDEFPRCPKPDCKHIYIDHPPSNATVDTDNEASFNRYAIEQQKMDLFKKGLGPQPVDVEGKKLKKIPPPVMLKKYVRCHCRQMIANPRTGDKCPIGCKDFPLRQCPICLCTCSLYATEEDFRDIAAVEALEVEDEEPADEAKNWLDSNLDANIVQRQQSNNIYRKRVKEGRMSNDSPFTSNIVKEGALAQSLNMVGNPQIKQRLFISGQRLIRCSIPA